jgi:hypothetical protein
MDPFDDVLATMDIANSRYIRVQARAPWGISSEGRRTPDDDCSGLVLADDDGVRRFAGPAEHG